MAIGYTRIDNDDGKRMCIKKPHAYDKPHLLDQFKAFWVLYTLNSFDMVELEDAYIN